MARIDEETRSRRKERVWLEVRQHNGIRQSEISEQLQLGNRSVNNYLRELWDEGKVFKEGRLWYSLPYQETRLRRFTLSPEEAMTIYLATRLYVKQQDKRHEAAESALYRLAEVLTSDAQVGKEIRQAANELARRDTDLQYSRVFREIIRGYIYRRRLRIKYEPYQGDPFETIFSVYLLEPSAIGYATYMIGHSDIVNDRRSFKIERVLSAELTNEVYDVPSDFPGLDILRSAWSIISGEQTQRIVLRFNPKVRRRVLETKWHPSQMWEEDPDKLGYLRWWVDVADTTDMKPWIRGWGADVEVLEPELLRESMGDHVYRLALTYGFGPDKPDLTSRLIRLWGKTSKNTDAFHPVLFHMFDVGHVAQQLLSTKASSRWRRVLSQTLNCDPDTLHEWLPWIIALHDIGKISPPFQVINESQKQRLIAEGFDFGSYSSEHRRLSHPIIGSIVLKDWAKSFPRPWRTVFLDMVAGHHGTYQHPERMHTRLWATLEETEEWIALRKQAIHILRSNLLLYEPDSWPQPSNISAGIVALNGFTILCDWLGSDENYFKPKAHLPLSKYLLHSRRQARDRVQSAGFFTPTVSQSATSFSDLFEWETRPLQRVIDEIPDDLLKKPSLTIIEAPTGEGKTEAALTLAHRVGREQGSDEMYIALPTTATSNAMFMRVREHLQERLKLPAELVKLIHGQDFLIEDDLEVAPLANGDDLPHPALNWFAPKKRALLASFAVGTIDQVELAALNVRHNALRLIGLAGKVIILDEIHAYDTYMTTIIVRMLNWLSALGCSVILLSATLPIARRRQLVEAYTQAKMDHLDTDSYPLLLVASSDNCFSANPKPIQERKIVQLNTLHFGEEDWTDKAQWLIDKAEDGGCVCWISNTVHRAQQIYNAVRTLAPADIECDLLHARMPIEDRQEKEKRILEKYGKAENGKRPNKGIIIGTQVLEQSLDIDFDLLASDLAPIDLLLQRIGRLHRHPQRRNRAKSHAQPHAFISCVLDLNNQLVIGADRFYTPYILHKTWEELQDKLNDKGEIVLPQNYRPLIEAVYDETPPSKDSDLFTAWQERQKKETKYQDEAIIRVAGEPDPNRPFWRGHQHTFDEDEDSANWIVAQTRYQERESITVIPMKHLGNDRAQLYGKDEEVALNEPADRKTQIRLLRRSMRISNYYVVTALKVEEKSNKNFSLFAESALLKRCCPLWLNNGVWTFSAGDKTVSVKLDPDLGLVIELDNPYESGESA